MDKAMRTDIKNDLMAGIARFFKQPEGDGIAKSRYMELYTHVYNYCTSPRGEPADSVDNKESAARTGATSYGFELYLSLRDFLEHHTTDLVTGATDLRGDDLLRYYTRCWETYQLRTQVLDGLCAYLNRHWIRREADEGRRNVRDIYRTGLAVWRAGMLYTLAEKVADAALSLIYRERHGEAVENINLVSVFVRCLVEVGCIKEPDTPAQNQRHGQANSSLHLAYYCTYFQNRFIDETEQFYTLESADFLQNNTVARYVRKVEQRIQEEEKRVKLYLHESTLTPLTQCLERVMIAQQIEPLHAEFQILLQKPSSDEVLEELRHIYQLVARVQEHLIQLKCMLEEQIVHEGHAAIEKQAGEADPATYVHAVLEVYKRFHAMVLTSFSNDCGFIAALDKACKRFVNDNAVTRAANHASRSPELLARYCDVVLRKGGTKNVEEEEVEDMLSDVMIVFTYVEDKDVFQKFYTNMLARRLVGGLSASDDAEASMISKLKQACGFEYTSKLQRMFQDMDISKALNEGFRDSSRNSNTTAHNVDFNILVLSSGCWPYQISVQEFVVPPELERPLQQFSQFYSGRHSGRKLIWMHSLSRGELVTGCFSSRYTLQASTFQMAVLLQFNTQLSWNFGQLQEATGISDEILLNVLKLLLKAKLISTDGTSDDIDAQSVVNLRTNYRNRKVVVNINLPIRGQLTKSEQEKTHQNIEEDRKVLIQAAIVRIAKTRRTVKHQQLVAEVLEYFSSQFRPSIHIIKKCIDILIEKEYLERAEGEKDTYNYLA